MGGYALPAYRLYRLDGAGKIATADWIDAEADDDALRQAREAGGNFELWQRRRLIGRVPEGSASPRSPC